MSDPFRIAVVDDDVAVREGAALVVDTEGRAVETFENGEDFLLAATGGQRWDLVFLDLKMPGKTGFEVLRALPLENGKLPFPILMVSAHGGKPSSRSSPPVSGRSRSGSTGVSPTRRSRANSTAVRAPSKSTARGSSRSSKCAMSRPS